MTNKEQHLVNIFLSLLSILGLAMSSPVRGPGAASVEGSNGMFLHASAGSLEASTSLSRQAERLRKRVRDRFQVSVSEIVAENALVQRRNLLAQSVTVSFSNPEEGALKIVPIVLANNVSWVKGEFYPNAARFTLDTERMTLDLKELNLTGLSEAQNSTIIAVHEDYGVVHVDTEGTARTGYQVDHEKLAAALKDSLENQQSELAFEVPRTPGKIFNATGYELGKLELLSTGRSNFEGSGDGRKGNVRKGIQEKMSNLLVAPGQKFSFNKVLGKMEGGGWFMALGIFNGNELRPVLGGGICQVATTVYRAALLAGLPITERANHSLYVTYYEKYGVGIDATIYPGQQDLAFTNDSSNYVFIQSYTDGDDAFVNFYGTKDGRAVTLKGPYLTSNSPEGFKIEGRDLHVNEIVWEQSVAYGDGHTAENVILSRYQALPKRLKKEYTLAQN